MLVRQQVCTSAPSGFAPVLTCAHYSRLDSLHATVFYRRTQSWRMGKSELEGYQRKGNARALATQSIEPEVQQLIVVLIMLEMFLRLNMF